MPLKIVRNDITKMTVDAIVKRNHGLWCEDAERYLLKHAPRI